MKKTIKLGILLLMITLVLTGCVDSETAFKLNKNDSIDVTMTSTIYEEKYKNLLGQFYDIEGISDEEINESLTGSIEEQKGLYEASGYTVETSSNAEEKTTELKANKSYDNIEKIKEEIEQIPGLMDITIKDREDGKREISIKIDMSEGNEGMEEALKDFNYTFKLELPYSVESSNATETSSNKKVLTWDISLTEAMELTVVTNKVVKSTDGTYREPLNTAIIIIGIAIVAVAVIGIVIVILSNKGKKVEKVVTKEEDEASNKEESIKGDDKTEENN